MWLVNFMPQPGLTGGFFPQLFPQLSLRVSLFLSLSLYPYLEINENKIE